MSGDNFLPPHNQKQKVYRENYRADKRRREIVFKRTEYKKIEAKAKEYQRPIGEFIKECIFAYFDNKYLVHDENLFRALMIELKRIGNNVNQITHRVNKQKGVAIIDTLKVSKNIKEIEVLVKNSIARPPDLYNEIQKAIQNPQTMYEIEVMIYNQKLKSNDCKNKQMEKGGVQ